MNYQHLKTSLVGIRRKSVFVLSALGCISLGSIGAYVQGDDELCDGELGIINGSFTDKDALGQPLGWKVRDEETTGLTVTVDEEVYHSAPGAVKLEFKEGFKAGQPMITQGMDNNILQSLPVGAEFTAKAWVKTIDVPPMGGFQLVAHNGATLPGPPWFKSLGWITWGSSSGTKDWHEVTGTFKKTSAEVTGINIHIYLKSSMPATAWVDDIEICLVPPTDVHHQVTAKKQPINISIDNRMVNFKQPTNYQVDIVSPNGRQVIKQSGYGTSVDLQKKAIAPGCYIVNIKSDAGNLVQPYVVSGTK